MFSQIKYHIARRNRPNPPPFTASKRAASVAAPLEIRLERAPELDIDISHGTPTVGPRTARQDWELGLTFSPISGTRMAVGLL
jgi:hypothetical protein